MSTKKSLPGLWLISMCVIDSKEKKNLNVIIIQESYEFPLDGRASEPLFSRRDVVSDPRSNGSCASPDFAAIAAQILDKSFSADGLMPTHEEADMYFGSSTPSGTMELKPSQPSNPKITVAAAKQNVANVAARIAAIEHKDRAKQNAANRQVCTPPKCFPSINPNTHSCMS